MIDVLFAHSIVKHHLHLKNITPKLYSASDVLFPHLVKFSLASNKHHSHTIFCEWCSIPTLSSQASLASNEHHFHTLFCKWCTLPSSPSRHFMAQRKIQFQSTFCRLPNGKIMETLLGIFSSCQTEHKHTYIW